MRVHTITHQSKRIFFLDFSNLKSEEEIKSVIEESANLIRKQAPASSICLANIEEMHFNNQIKDMFLNFVKGNKPYMKASAIVGVKGLRQILFNGIMKVSGRDVKSFDSENQAKEWLVSQN